MVLALEKGEISKIKEYKKNIDRLISNIKYVLSNYKDEDKKHDLNVLLLQTKCLKGTVDNVFKV
jgi:hypothetical protein